MSAAADGSIEIRPATEADIPAIREILAQHENDGPVVVADTVGPYLRHVVRHGRARVAVDGDLVVGYGASIDTGRSQHLADLFVRADRLGRGIGRPLLDAAFGDASRRTTFASDDPRAVPVYVRAGMLPLWVSLYVEGPVERIRGLPASMTVEPAAPAELAAIDRSWSGTDRGPDYAFWGSMPEAETFVVRDSGAVVAVGASRIRQASPVRVLDHLVVAPDPAVDPVPATMAAIVHAGRGGLALATVQGPSPVLRPLLDLGFRVIDRDQFMASETGLIDPARLIPNPGIL